MPLARRRIFLSYSSRNRARAEEISLALEAQGHEVFFDRADLVGGEDYGDVIRRQIARADLFVFLITPSSVADGSYSLSELRLARDRWPRPGGRVLPVLLEPTAMAEIPAYLRSVTLFQPEGNVAAEVAAWVARRRSRFRSAPVVLIALALLAFGWIGARTLLRDDSAERWPVDPNAFVTRFVYPAEEIRRSEFTLDPTFPEQADWSQVLTVTRAAFGEIPEIGAAMSVEALFTNCASAPIRLDLTPRFFELMDDQGRKSELLYFCCRSGGEMLGPGQERRIQLIFKGDPGWEGKSTSARWIEFHVNGLLPLTRGAWVMPALATAE